MKLLIIDYYKQPYYELENLLKIVLKEVSIKFENNKENILDTLKSNKYDFILLDLKFQEENILEKEIIEITPKQKIIIMSEELNKCCKKGCKYCINFFKQKRILKPINVKEIINILNDFEIPCRFAHKFNHNSACELIGSVLSNCLYHSYNEKSKIIVSEQDNYQVTKEFISIINLLKEYNINFEILDSRIVKIIK